MQYIEDFQNISLCATGEYLNEKFSFSIKERWSCVNR